MIPQVNKLAVAASRAGSPALKVSKRVAVNLRVGNLVVALAVGNLAVGRQAKTMDQDPARLPL